MQLGFYFDQSRCIGCYTCVVACKDWHDVDAGPANWVRIRTIEKGKFPDLSVSFLFTTCFHCSNLPCVKACPVKAITKRENGIVLVNTETCLGGETCKFACRMVCPYGAPQFSSKPNAHMQKCDLCLDRWEIKKKPICVDSCPVRALDAGPLDELQAKYGDMQEAEGFSRRRKIMSSIIFKGKLERRPT